MVRTLSFKVGQGPLTQVPPSHPPPSLPPSLPPSHHALVLALKEGSRRLLTADSQGAIDRKNEVVPGQAWRKGGREGGGGGVGGGSGEE